ncbi:MAG: hypothetical protein GX130_00665 [Candidatus Hydrogenedens sp.]|nr:hypothetical protein [Candidatus Hydrogenedens sp.]
MRRFIPKQFFSGLLLCAFLLGLSFSCRGDLLTLQNEESLSGTLLRIRKSTLVFRTSLEGQMMLPVDRAKKLTTQNIFSIQLQDGRTLIGRFGQAEGEQVLFPPDPTSFLSLNLEMVVEALPIPSTSSAREEEPALPRLQEEKPLRLQTTAFEEKAEGAVVEEPASLREALGLSPVEDHHSLRDSMVLSGGKREDTPLMLQSGLKPRIWSSDEDHALFWLENLFKNSEELPPFLLQNEENQLRIQLGPESVIAD